jgi:hypothetical protein
VFTGPVLTGPGVWDVSLFSGHHFANHNPKAGAVKGGGAAVWGRRTALGQKDLCRGGKEVVTLMLTQEAKRQAQGT